MIASTSRPSGITMDDEDAPAAAMSDEVMVWLVPVQGRSKVSPSLWVLPPHLLGYWHACMRVDDRSVVAVGV